MCVDRGSKPKPVVQNVQQVHFQPSRPYPCYVLGPGGEPVKPMPSAWTQKVGVPPYNLRALTFPSTTGPYTYMISTGLTGPGGADAVVGSGGQASQHNLGLS
jgi:hypothetical protein